MNWNDIVAYDPTAPSCLRWKIKPSAKVNIGDPVGYPKNRRGKTYYEFEYLKKHCQCARVVWEMHYGSIPDGRKVDHIKNVEYGECVDNRIENLRVCTNQENTRKSLLSKANSSGFKGVHLHSVSKKWVAQIRLDGGPKYLGQFIDPIDAAKAYDKAAIEHFGEFALTNKSLGLV